MKKKKSKIKIFSYPSPRPPGKATPRPPGFLRRYMRDRSQGYKLAKPVNRWDRADD